MAKPGERICNRIAAIAMDSSCARTSQRHARTLLTPYDNATFEDPSTFLLDGSLRIILTKVLRTGACDSPVTQPAANNLHERVNRAQGSKAREVAIGGH